MKRIVIVFFAFLLFVGILSSCRSRHTCPAYKNGSAQVDQVSDSEQA